MVHQKPTKERRVRLTKGNEIFPEKGESEKQISLTAKTKHRKMQLSNPYAQQQVKNSASKPSSSPQKPGFGDQRLKRIEPFHKEEYPEYQNKVSNLEDFLYPEYNQLGVGSSRKSSTSSREKLKSKSKSRKSSKREKQKYRENSPLENSKIKVQKPNYPSRNLQDKF